MTLAEIQTLAKQTAVAHQLDPKIVMSVVEQESGWNPFAMRWEPGFYMKYVKPHEADFGPTEAMARSFSWGLMQVMGQVAREFGFKGAYLSMLCNEYAGLDIGCKVLKSKLNSHPSSIEAGLLAWNGGGNPKYPGQVLARVKNYV